MSAPDPRELIGAYVLGACTPEEAAEVRAQMAASPAFRAEVESFDPVRDALLEVPAPDVRPGADLKRRLMAQVQEEASLFAAAGTTGGHREAAPPAPAERHHEASAAQDDDRTTTGDDRPSTPVADDRSGVGRDAAQAPAADGGAAVHRADGIAPARGTAPAGPGRTGFLAALRHPARATALAAVLVALVVGGIVVGTGGSDTQRYEGNVLARTSGDASVELVSTGSERRLQVRGLPAPGSGKQYQVWLQRGQEAPRPTKVLFGVDARGRADAEIPDDITDVDHVLVTAEPNGGSPAPTSSPVLSVDV